MADTFSSRKPAEYCQSLDMCSSIYADFHFELGDASYYPVGAAHLSENRLFGMFHSNTPQHNKDIILQSFLKPDGIVCHYCSRDGS